MGPLAFRVTEIEHSQIRPSPVYYLHRIYDAICTYLKTATMTTAEAVDHLLGEVILRQV